MLDAADGEEGRDPGLVDGEAEAGGEEDSFRGSSRRRRRSDSGSGIGRGRRNGRSKIRGSETAEINSQKELLEIRQGGNARPEKRPEMVVMGVGEDGGRRGGRSRIVRVRQRGEDRHPVDGEAGDRATAGGADGAGKGNEGV